jgi:hypothetical protein
MIAATNEAAHHRSGKLPDHVLYCCRWTSPPATSRGTVPALLRPARDPRPDLGRQPGHPPHTESSLLREQPYRDIGIERRARQAGLRDHGLQAPQLLFIAADRILGTHIGRRHLLYSRTGLAVSLRALLLNVRNRQIGLRVVNPWIVWHCTGCRRIGNRGIDREGPGTSGQYREPRIDPSQGCLFRYHLPSDSGSCRAKHLSLILLRRLPLLEEGFACKSVQL